MIKGLLNNVQELVDVVVVVWSVVVDRLSPSWRCYCSQRQKHYENNKRKRQKIIYIRREKREKEKLSFPDLFLSF
jgi:hypothetical protein